MSNATRPTDLDTMTVEELREEFRRLRRNSEVSATHEEWMDEVRAIAPTNPSPIDWVHAAQVATTVCDKCHGSGNYHWGASVNGKMTHSGDCFRCQGKGHQNQDDYRRNWGHNKFAILSAYRAMVG